MFRTEMRGVGITERFEYPRIGSRRSDIRAALRGPTKISVVDDRVQEGPGRSRRASEGRRTDLSPAGPEQCSGKVAPLI